jgi:hypothetical protein
MNMHRKWLLSLLPISMALVAAEDQPWKGKQVAEWNEDDAKQVLSDSPWAKTTKPTIERSAQNSQRRSGGGMGRGGGIGMGGVGIGLPGMGRRGGMGGPGGGGYPGGGRRGGTDDPGTDYNEPPTLMVRWESAFPVREAELKARDTSAPTLDTDHYAIAVYGVPSRMASGDSQSLAKKLKKQAAIKRDGKKDLKPSGVQVLQREDGPVIVYLFPRSKEITRQDKRIEFGAQIGRLQLTQSFYVDDMNYQGKLEL